MNEPSAQEVGVLEMVTANFQLPTLTSHLKTCCCRSFGKVECSGTAQMAEALEPSASRSLQFRKVGSNFKKIPCFFPWFQKPNQPKIPCIPCLYTISLSLYTVYILCIYIYYIIIDINLNICVCIYI